MTGEQMLQHAAALLPSEARPMATPRHRWQRRGRWSITLGCPVTPAQVVLCMIDLKLTRLAHDPKHQRQHADVIGYAAVLPEVTR